MKYTLHLIILLSSMAISFVNANEIFPGQSGNDSAFNCKNLNYRFWMVAERVPGQNASEGLIKYKVSDNEHPTARIILVKQHRDNFLIPLSENSTVLIKGPFIRDSLSGPAATLSIPKESALYRGSIHSMKKSIDINCTHMELTF